MNPPYNWCERVGLAADGAEITVKNDQMVSEVSSGDRTAAAVSTPPPPPVVASACSDAPTEPADRPGPYKCWSNAGPERFARLLAQRVKCARIQEIFQQTSVEE